jgi:hypothetical protein
MTAVAHYSVYSGLFVLPSILRRHVLPPLCVLPHKIMQFGVGFGPSVVDQLLKSSEVDLAPTCFRSRRSNVAGTKGDHLGFTFDGTKIDCAWMFRAGLLLLSVK